MIRFEGVTKCFGKIPAVRGLSFEVKKGEVFSFLGPNGAGKTTSIRLLTGILLPTEGEVFVGGLSVAKCPVQVKQKMGYIPDRPYLYEKLTGWEFLDFCGRIYRVKDSERKERIDRYLSLFHMDSFRDQMVESYSLGMRQKILISAALIHEPEVLVVDEPLVGLDPRSARVVKDLFLSLSDQGMTVFMSTHLLDIAEDTSDRIGIMCEGELVAVGKLDELRKKSGQVGGKLEGIFLKLLQERENKDKRER